MSKKYQVLGSLAQQFGAIPSPTKAVEGQMLIVKAVDENGMPTEWEVITPPEGFSGNYNELYNRPSIPSSVVQVTNEFAFGASDESITDATDWQTQTSPLTQRQRACVYGGGYYIVCGTSGDFAYSKDGVNWTKITAFTSSVITGICYGKGMFIAVDNDGVIWQATDPTSTWKTIETGLDIIIEAVCYLNNRFIVACDGGIVAFSDNGVEWSIVQTCTTNNLYGITAGNGMYVAVGASGCIITSVDGNTWVDKTNSAITKDLRCVSYGNGMFIAGGASGVVECSSDAETWVVGSSNTTSTINYIRAIAYAYGSFYAVMYTSTGGGEVWTSKDCVSWTVQYSSATRLWCATVSDSMVIASGDSGAIYSLDFDVQWLNERPENPGNEPVWQRVNVVLSDGSVITSEAYLESHVAEIQSFINSKLSEHNVNTDAHNDIRLLIEGLTTRLNAIANSEDVNLDQFAEIVAYIKANRSLIESITTNKVNVSDIVDNLTTNVSNKPVSAAQVVVLKGLIDALQTAVNSKAATSDLSAHTGNKSNPHGVTAAQVGAYSKSETDTKLGTKANAADIATTKYAAMSNSTVAYVKISDFGAWGTGAWYEKAFSMLVSSRAGETIWVSVSSDDSNTNARAFRLMNTYSKMSNIYYSASESAIYVKVNAWCNNVTAHLLTNINGDYVPTVASVSALASDAVEINIVEFGINSTSAVVGDSSVKLEMGGSEAKPTYNGNNMALDTIVTVDATSGAKSLTFTADNSNNEWRYVYASGITSLTLASSGTFANTAEAYYSIVFISGTTATTITNTLGAYFTGDDCADGVFVPVTSKTYDLGVWWNGVKWQAVVRGV